jgi:uncharacterized protein (TIGR00369 family)
MKEAVCRWIEESPYGVSLGVKVEEIGESLLRLELPYRDDNSNPGKALHGGVAASMIALAGGGVSRVALGGDAAPFHLAAVQVDYLAAAIGEPVRAEATLLRRGKEICFSQVRVETETGKPIAQGLCLVHGRHGADEVEAPAAQVDESGADPGSLAAHMQRLPFISKLGVRIERMANGRSRVVLPRKEGNMDESGGVHEGVVLALLDTTGAMASLSMTGTGEVKPSTPGIQARIIAPPPNGDLVACGNVLHRDRSLFFADVEIAAVENARVVAQGTVVYRIVTQ